MSDPVLSPDGFWQLDDGEWVASEKQTVALANGAIPHGAVITNSTSLEERSGNTSFFAKLKPKQKLYIFSGVCLASICLSLIIVLASLSPISESHAPVTDCSANNTNLVSGFEAESTVSESENQEEVCPHELKIGSWNLEVFGQSKANNQQELSEIAEKISYYDVIAVQEIKDKNPGTAPYILQDEVETYGEYGMILSNRTGVYCEENPYASEQYAFFYNNDTIKPLEEGHHYPDTDCEFSREPFAARFQSTEYDYTFVLITLHVKPDDAVDEINALVNVFEWAKFQYPNEDDFILLGDLNADCSYASSSELDELDIRNGDYQWIIPDGTNTNTAESSSCAYDRMIIGDGGTQEFLGSYSTDCEVEASDHCIISAKFSAHES